MANDISHRSVVIVLTGLCKTSNSNSSKVSCLLGRKLTEVIYDGTNSWKVFAGCGQNNTLVDSIRYKAHIPFKRGINITFLTYA